MLIRKFSLCVTLFILFIPIALFGQPAPMDSTFGVNGIVQFQRGFSSLLRDMELLPDGKILIAGNGSSETYVARFNPDGSLDDTFGDDGVVTTTVGNLGLHSDLIPLPDGKFISVGQAKDEASPFQTPLFAVLRFNADGTLDPTFGQLGVTTTRFNMFGAFSQFGTLQPDGKILVVGQANLGSGLRYAWARYYPDGKIDSTFSENGVTTLPTGGSGVPTCVALLPNGKILTGGAEAGSDPGAKFLLSRLLPNGVIDSTFGINGVFSHWFGNYFEVIEDIAVLPNGKILAGGWVGPTTDGSFALLRLNENGSLDTGFGNNGLVEIKIGHDNVLSQVDVLPNGKIICSGSGTDLPPTGSTPPYKAYVMRFHSDGSFDNSFNSTGLGTISTGYAAGGNDQIIQPDGKILIGGFYYPLDTLPPQIMLARVLNEALNATYVPTLIQECSVSPNPSEGFVTLRYILERPTQISIGIYDMLGRCVQTVVAGKNAVAGENTEQFDVSKLPSGLYQILLESPFDAASVRLVK